MPRPKSALEIFRLLERSNCKECGEKTCLAFAGAVFTGQRRLRECQRLNQEAVEGFAEEADNQSANEQSPEEYLKKLKSKVARLDLAEAAERVGGQFK